MIDFKECTVFEVHKLNFLNSLVDVSASFLDFIDIGGTLSFSRGKQCLVYFLLFSFLFFFLFCFGCFGEGGGWGCWFDCSFHIFCVLGLCPLLLAVF